MIGTGNCGSGGVLEMRPWAGPFGFVGAAASLVFWIVVPNVAGGHNLYLHAGNEGLYIAFAVLSGIGIIGAVMAAGSSRLAPLLLVVAIIPGIGAWLVPGLLLVIAALIAAQEPEAARPA